MTTLGPESTTHLQVANVTLCGPPLTTVFSNEPSNLAGGREGSNLQSWREKCWLKRSFVRESGIIRAIAGPLSQNCEPICQRWPCRGVGFGAG